MSALLVAGRLSTFSFVLLFSVMTLLLVSTRGVEVCVREIASLDSVLTLLPRALVDLSVIPSLTSLVDVEDARTADVDTLLPSSVP